MELKMHVLEDKLIRRVGAEQILKQRQRDVIMN